MSFLEDDKRHHAVQVIIVPLSKVQALMASSYLARRIALGIAQWASWRASSQAAPAVLRIRRVKGHGQPRIRYGSGNQMLFSAAIVLPGLHS